MKHNGIKKMMAFVSALALCTGLNACGGNGKKTAEKFLTAIQTQDFATAVTCMDEGGRLNRVFNAVNGTSVPELDEVFRIFSKQMGEMTFEIVGKGEQPGQFNVRIQNRDYDAAISGAMNTALQAQTEGGGDSFSNYAGWLEQGVSQAVMGEKGEEMMTVAKEEQESTYYIAAQGDRVIGCIMMDAVIVDLSGASEENLAQMVEESEKKLRGMKGISPTSFQAK